VALELLRLEHAGLLIDDMLREVEHILRNFHVLDLVEVFFFVSDFVGYPRSVPTKPLKAMMCSRLVSTTRPIATMFMSRTVSRITAKASCQPCHRDEVVGTDDVARIDLLALHELVDVDGARGLQHGGPAVHRAALAGPMA
jgi:hypothetical protein